MNDNLKKPVLVRSLNPSVNTKNRKKYYIELIDYYRDLYYDAKTEPERSDALKSLNATQIKLDTLICNVVARRPKRNPLI